MRRQFKKYLVPHEENDHQPHMLRSGATKKIIAVACAIELVILVLILPSRPAALTERIHNLAAIFPSVLVEKANKTRLAEAKGELVVSDELTYAAQLKANDMAEKGYFAHNSPDGKTPWHWLGVAGYKYQSAGENLAVNFVDSSDVHEAWLDSPTHRANIVRDGFTEIGIATAEGEYKGKKAIFVAQFFGTPQRRVDTIAKIEAVAVAGQEPAAASSGPSHSDVLGAEVAVEEPSREKPAEGNAASDPMISETKREEIETTSVTTQDVPTVASVERKTSIFEKAVASPRVALSVLLWGLAALVSLALVLKIVVKMRIQYPKLVMNGATVLVLIYTFSLLNDFVIRMFSEIV